jgi:hypothetical protein
MKKASWARDSLLTAKDKICFSPGAACNPDECPFAKGYYDKIKKAMEEACEAGYRFDYAHVVALAKKYAMCPFELQLDLSLWSDIIIGDYNYFFDPLVHLERYFGPEADASEDLVLIDEAHNLVERGRICIRRAFRRTVRESEEIPQKPQGAWHQESDQQTGEDPARLRCELGPRGERFGRPPPRGEKSARFPQQKGD